jgi:hypothetical protein
MPKQIQLFNQHIEAKEGTKLVDNPEDPGAPLIEKMWTLTFSDRTYMDQHIIEFGQDARDHIVKVLTGGIVLAGGDLPQKPPPEGI